MSHHHRFAISTLPVAVINRNHRFLSYYPLQSKLFKANTKLSKVLYYLHSLLHLHAHIRPLTVLHSALWGGKRLQNQIALGLLPFQGKPQLPKHQQAFVCSAAFSSSSLHQSLAFCAQLLHLAAFAVSFLDPAFLANISYMWLPEPLENCTVFPNTFQR